MWRNFFNLTSRTKNQVTLRKKKTPAAITAPDIVLLGDSNTEISYFASAPEKRWAYILEKRLNAKIVNMGKNGRSTFDYIRPDSYTGADNKGQLIKYNAKYYLIKFGLNDEKYITPAQFETDTRELINIIRTQTRGIPILITNVWVDYPEHYSSDRNTYKIKPFDDVKRTLAAELNLHLIDVYARFKYEHDTNGIWDTRIRNVNIWDNSADAGKTVGAPDYWWNDIHYNVKGNEIVADEIAKYFQAKNLTI